jgi:hypothetical protein
VTDGASIQPCCLYILIESGEVPQLKLPATVPGWRENIERKALVLFAIASPNRGNPIAGLCKRNSFRLTITPAPPENLHPLRMDTEFAQSNPKQISA